MHVFMLKLKLLAIWGCATRAVLLPGKSALITLIPRWILQHEKRLDLQHFFAFGRNFTDVRVEAQQNRTEMWADKWDDAANLTVLAIGNLRRWKKPQIRIIWPERKENGPKSFLNALAQSILNIPGAFTAAKGAVIDTAWDPFVENMYSLHPTSYPEMNTTSTAEPTTSLPQTTEQTTPTPPTTPTPETTSAPGTTPTPPTTATPGTTPTPPTTPTPETTSTPQTTSAPGTTPTPQTTSAPGTTSTSAPNA